jgi:hypothetical protein
LFLNMGKHEQMKFLMTLTGGSCLSKVVLLEVLTKIDIIESQQLPPSLTFVDSHMAVASNNGQATIQRH